MKMKNKNLYQILDYFFNQTLKKFFKIKNNFSLNLFFIFLGFIVGNTFGSFLNNIRNYIFMGWFNSHFSINFF